MVECPSCKKENQDDVKFCGYCGRELEKKKITGETIAVIVGTIIVIIVISNHILDKSLVIM